MCSDKIRKIAEQSVDDEADEVADLNDEQHTANDDDQTVAL
jgi:hypothetical protein